MARSIMSATNQSPEYGNHVGRPTVLFVLERARARGLPATVRCLTRASGPGFHRQLRRVAASRLLSFRSRAILAPG